MRDLRSQLRAYAEHLDATAPGLDELDLERPVPAVRPAPTPTRWRRSLVAAGATFFVVAAIGVAALLFRTDGAGVTATTDSATTTTLTDLAAPPSSLVVAGDGPVLSFGERDDGERLPFAGPGGVVRGDGIFHMFFNRYGEGESQVGYATSPDLNTWQVEADVLLTDEDVPEAAFGIRVRSAARLPSGEWTLFFDYEMKSESESHPPRIGLAVATSPTGPWSVAAASVLDNLPSWSEGGVESPSVLAADDGFVMYFTGFDGEGDGRIGRATSVDGRSWSVDSEPLLEPTQEWERGSLTQPNVVFDGERWLMLYAGRTPSGQGFVVSRDGVRWEPAQLEATLTVGDMVRPQIRDTELTLAPDGSVLILIENGGARTTSEIWLMVVGE